MTLRLQRFDDHTKMPWKNGLGITREVAIHAPEGDPSAFLWRISLATVSGSGPFSAFPGLDRTIAVLAGDGMRLTVDGVEQAPLTEASEPYSFSGDSAVYAQSIGGETTDLNIMTRRGQFEHDLRKVIIEKESDIAIEPSIVALVFAGVGLVTTARRSFDISPGDVLLNDFETGKLSLSIAATPNVIFVVRVSAAGR